MPRKLITVSLYGASETGKTTQSGEYALDVKRRTGKDTVLYSSDRGGFDAIEAHVEAGFIKPVVFDPQVDDPWVWIDQATKGVGADKNVGLAIYDSGSSIAEHLLTACHKSDWQVGQQKTQKFKVTHNEDTLLTVSLNNEAHYGLVQTFMMDAIWASTFLTKRGMDVLWTFQELRGEDQEKNPIIGPLLAGKALTPKMRKWFRYTFRLESRPQEGTSPTHRLYLTEYPNSGMIGGYSSSNSRYPLHADTVIPPYIEPASLPNAFEIINRGKEEALVNIKALLDQDIPF